MYIFVPVFVVYVEGWEDMFYFLSEDSLSEMFGV